MADDTSNDSALPPKLNLRKVAPAAVSAPQPAAKPAESTAPASPTAETMRIKLPATDVPEPAAKPTPTLTSKPDTPAGGPVRLKARPKPVVGTGPKPLTPPGAALKPSAATPTVLKPLTPKPAAPKPVASAATEPEADAPAAAATPAEADAPKAVKLKSVTLKPVAVGIKRPGADPNAPAGSKRETSKIPLESASAPPVTPMGPGANTKTIKIAPAPVDGSKISGPMVVSEGAAGEPMKPDSKRQTSRISLEAALGSDGTGNGEPAATGPKTIRLKRPSEAPTVKVKKAPDDDAGGELRKTAKIEMPPDEAETPATQRKTIKVKRPSQRRTVKSVSVKRGPEAEGDAAAAPAGAPQAMPAAEPVVVDSAHWTFITTAIAAMIVCFVLIYVLCAQVLGPNVSLTEVAYAAPDVELPWPGRIARQ